MHGMPVFGVVGGLLILACMGGGAGQTAGGELCATQDMPVLQIGHSVNGTFQPFEDAEGITPSVAPQGGFGLPVVLATAGLQAGDGAYADVLISVERNQTNEGTAFLPALPLLCSSDEVGGKITGVVAGLDPQKYQSNSDLLELDGEVVDVVATVTDGNGTSVQARQSVTVEVEG